VSRCRETFQVEIPLRHLFEVPTVAGLAESIEAARQAGEPVAPPHPAGFHGTETWSLICPAAAMVSSISWNQASRPTIFQPPSASRDPLNLAALEQSLNEIVSATNPLRTPLGKVEGRPRSDRPDLTIKLPVVDLAEAAGERAGDRGPAIGHRRSQRPFEICPEARSCGALCYGWAARNT